MFQFKSFIKNTFIKYHSRNERETAYAKEEQSAQRTVTRFDFFVVAVMLYLTMSGKVEWKAGVLIIFICVLATSLALYLIGAKNSSYGGRFKHNYPDAKK